ncbi:MAG: heavy metal translocating P-type ATPase [Chloroflexota bacterium]
MAIFGLALATGGAAAGIWGLDQFRRKKAGGTLIEQLKMDPLPPALEQAKGDIQALAKRVDDGYQLAIHNSIDRLFGQSYEKHLRALGGTTGVNVVPPMVRMRNRQIGYAAVALGFALTGTPSLILASFAINLYLTYVLIQIGIKDMWKKRTLTARGRQAFFAIGVLLGGFLVFRSVAIMASLFFEKLIATVQGQSHEQLANVFGELPQTVSRVEDGVVVSCPLSDVKAGDIVVVYAGEVIPVDGEIVAGHASIDQHALTGEAQPVEKETGDSVLASTMVLMGEIRVEARQTQQETLAAQITDILNNTKTHNTQVGLNGLAIADRWVFLTTGLGLLAWPLWGLSSMLAVLSVPVGGFLMMTTPLTLLGYLDMSARSNVLVKDGRSLDLLGTIDTVVFDKTGTLTLDQPTVCGIHRPQAQAHTAQAHTAQPHTAQPYTLSDDELLALAAAIEQRQSHPIAVAIREAAAEQSLVLPEVDETQVEVGYGLAVMFEGQHVQLGSQRFMNLSDVSIPDDIDQLATERQGQGNSIIYLALDGRLEGVIELQPTIRPEAETVINALRNQGVELAMITGDQEAPAQTLAASLGIDRVFANVLPEQKAQLVEELQAQGKRVMFVGDGINDSIALKQAEVSVSIAGATTVATDTAQIVLMDGTLAQLDALFELSERYERDMKAQYFLGVHLPASLIGCILLLGWGVGLVYTIGYGAFLAAMSIGFRPIWRQETLESNQKLLLVSDAAPDTEPDTVPDTAPDTVPDEERVAI